VVGLAAARAGASKLRHLTLRPFLSDEKRKAADRKNDAAIARLIFDSLCVLRGTALKAAQLIAMEMEFLPESYREEMAKASSDVPPMNRALVYKAVKSELGPPEKVFRDFDPLPFAAASLGQVHAARALDGRDLAVKVQYPGIADGVRSDIAMLKAVLAPTKYRRIFDGCFNEITGKLDEELDYQAEAKHTTLFREVVSGEGILVPVVAQDLSTRTILSTSRLDGMHIDDWLATQPSQDERDRYGQRLVDFFHHCVFRHGLIHADPHPGNYLFRRDGQLGVIDFGCTQRLEPDFVADLRALKHAANGKDVECRRALHGRIGIHYRPRHDGRAFDRFFADWTAWLDEPYQQERFDFSAEAGYLRRGSSFAKALYRYIDRYEGGFIYYARAEHGLYRMLEKLGAKVRMRPGVG
jgi:predicted unusual protein kinase regulating ubiquinone biosynthesis (AarF/ABC1/UbiB family)